jgi:predicted DNA binding CopG/RHH family protein
MIIDTGKKEVKKANLLKDLSENQKKCDAFVTFRLSSQDLHKVKQFAKDSNTNISKVMKSLINTNL